MQGIKRILIGLFAAFLVNPSHLSSGVDIEWKDPGETVGSRQTRDAPSHLSSIRDKLLNVTRFANGLALAESVAVGNISFGRIVTELMVADQFAPGSDWVRIFEQSYRPEMDKVISKLGPFESFLEKVSTFQVHEPELLSILKVIQYSKNLELLKKQVTDSKNIIKDFQKTEFPLDKVGDFIFDEISNFSIEIASALTLIPDGINSFLQLKANSSSVNKITEAFGLFCTLGNAKLANSLSNSVKTLAALPNMNSSSFVIAEKETTNILNSFRTINVNSLIGFDLENIANFISLHDISSKTIDHLEKLMGQIEKLNEFNTWLKTVEKNSHVPVTEKVSFEFSRMYSYAAEASNFQNIHNLLVVLKPGADLLLLEKMFSDKYSVSEANKTEPSFLDQSKLFEAFDGLQSFIGAVEMASSEDGDVKWEDGVKQRVALEVQISKQLEEVQVWLRHLQFLNMINVTIKSIEWLKINGKGYQNTENNLISFVRNANKMMKISKAKVGYESFVSLLTWLKDIPEWAAKLRLMTKIPENTQSYPRSPELLLRHISNVLSFFSQFLELFPGGEIKYAQTVKAKNISKIDRVPESLVFIQDYYEKYHEEVEFEEMGAPLQNYVAKSLEVDVTWDGMPEKKVEVASIEQVESSSKLIKEFHENSQAVGNSEQLLSEVNTYVSSLEGLLESAKEINKTILSELKVGLIAIGTYKGKKIVAVPAINSSSISSILSRNSSHVSVLTSLIGSLRIYSDLISGIGSVEAPKKLTNEILSAEDVPKEVKSLLKNFQVWLGSAHNLEILSNDQIGLKSVSLLHEITSIKGKLGSLIAWLNAVPKDIEPARVRKSTNFSSLMNGNPQEEKFVKLKHLIEKAQDPETTEAIEQLGKDLTRLAGIFGIEEKIITTARVPTCQEDPSSPSCKTTDSPPNANSASVKNPTKNALGMISEESSTQAGGGWLMDNLFTLIAVVAFTLLLLVGACIFFIRKKKKQAAKEDVESSSKSHSKSESLEKIPEQNKKKKESKEKVQKSAEIKEEVKTKSVKSKEKEEVKAAKSAEKPDKKQEEKPTEPVELKEDKTAEMDPEDEEGIPLIRRLFPTFDPACEDLVFLAHVNVISSRQTEALKCIPCINNVCPMTRIDGNLLNRYPTRSVCQDKNRVFLTVAGKPWYIHAQYVTMPNGRKFIATQGPLPHTVDHFFAMIMQENSKVVCQLCDAESCATYLEKKETDWFFISTKSVETGLNEISRTEVTLKRKSDNAEYVFTHLWNKQWPEDGAPANFQETVDMLQLAKEIAGDTIIVVHCFDGTGRTMAFIGMEYGNQRHTRTSSNIDKLIILNDLREMRYGAVTKQAQFYFMYYGVVRLWMKNKKISESDFPNLNQQYSKALERYETEQRALQLKIANETEKRNIDLIRTIMPTFEMDKIDPAIFASSFNVEGRVKEMKCADCASMKKICENGTDPDLNRYPKFSVCGEPNRVPLTFNGKPQYINAQFMIMPNGVTFIATQGPTQNSVDHFLEMLFQYEVKVVCMLCKCIEPDPLNPEVIKNKCGDYLRLNEGDGDEALKSSLYTVNRKEVPCEVKGVIWTELAITRLKDKKKHVVTHFWNTEWPDHKLPNLPVETVRLMRLVKMIGDKAPIVVHCSAGVGRTVSFIGMEFAFQKMTRRQGYPDRSLIIKELREMRFASLPEVQQLYFIFFGLLCMWKNNELISAEEFTHLERIYQAMATVAVKKKAKKGKKAKEEKSQENKSQKDNSKKEAK